MAVLRIVANVFAADVAETRAFYEQLFGLTPAMDFGWIATLVARTSAPVQISIASEGGSGTAVPDLSIEVGNLDEILTRARAMGCPILYGPVEEPWGVRRFYLNDPAGKLLNVLQHLEK